MHLIIISCNTIIMSNYCQHILGCNGAEILLSANRSIAPFELVRVSKNVTQPENLDYTRVYNFGYDQFLDAWCSDNYDPMPEVELGFSTPVVITGIISGGRIESSTSEGSSSYVSRFTLQYVPIDKPSTWIFYTTEDFRGPKVCAQCCSSCTHTMYTHAGRVDKRISLQSSTVNFLPYPCSNL